MLGKLDQVIAGVIGDSQNLDARDISARLQMSSSGLFK